MISWNRVRHLLHFWQLNDSQPSSGYGFSCDFTLHVPDTMLLKRNAVKEDHWMIYLISFL